MTKINCNKKPKIPFENWTVEEHIESGQIELDKIKLITKLEEGESFITGHKFRERLKGDKSVTILNANVIDFLGENQDEPAIAKFLEPYKGKVLYAFGTIYRDSPGYLYARCLIWRGGRWVSDYGWLSNDWDLYGPAFVLANNLDSSDSGRQVSHYPFWLSPRN